MPAIRPRRRKRHTASCIAEPCLHDPKRVMLMADPRLVFATAVTTFGSATGRRSPP